MKKISQKIFKLVDEFALIKSGDKILVAFSGGPDSVFLIHFLLKYKSRFNISVSAFHLNHRLRGTSAKEDEEFCRKFCASLKIPLFVSRKNVKAFAKNNKLSIEEGARILRYAELQKLCKKKNFNLIATAHNANDNAETVLLNLFKGCGLSGLSGIPVKRENIIRPMLTVSKQEILNFLNKNNIKYQIDLTNFNDSFERNFIRNKILPLIKSKINPSVENAILRTSFIVKDFNSKLKSETDNSTSELVEFDKNNGSLSISLKHLEDLSNEKIKIILNEVLDKYFGLSLSYLDLQKIKSLAKNISGTKAEFTGNIIALRERESIKIFNRKPEERFSQIEFKVGKKVKLSNNKEILIEEAEKLPSKFPSSGNSEYISGDNLSDYFILRTWKAGDKFYPLGMNHSKKVSDFLTEAKIPSSTKEKQLVLINENKIVWLLGLRIDNRFRIKKNTKRILHLCLN